MLQIEQQILRSTLNELQSDLVDSITDPQLQGRLQIIRYLLAHALSNDGQQAQYSSIEEELSAIKEFEQKEQQFLAGNSTEKQDIAVSAAVLTPYLQEKLSDPDLCVTDIKSLLGGISKFTYIVGLSGGKHSVESLVIRHDLVGGPVESKAADEFGVIKLAFEQGIPVAEPLWADYNPPFGGTCLVTKRAEGATAFDITGSTLGDNGKDAALALAQVLGKIHRIPVNTLPLPPELVSASLEQHIRLMIEFYEEQWKRRRVSVSPTLEAAFQWLYNNIPSGRPVSLVHGDASLRNLLVHNGQVSAILDWELWHAGDHNEDLSYCRRDVEPSLGWDVFLAEYYRHGGQQFDEFAGEYFAIFGDVRNAVFADNCLHSFSIPSPKPEPKLAYGALAMGRALITDIANRLKKLQAL